MVYFHEEPTTMVKPESCDVNGITQSQTVRPSLSARRAQLPGPYRKFLLLVYCRTHVEDYFAK